MILVSSCRDFVDPNIPYSEFDNGTYLRTIRTASASSVAPSLTFNFFALNSAKFEATFEIVDNNLGGTLDNVTFSVRHLRIGATGQVYTPSQPRLLKTLSSSDFTSNAESKFPRATVSITAAEVAAAVGLSFDQLEGGDFFDISAELTDSKGRVFNADNASPDVRGGFFYDSPFLYRVGVVCPSDLGGTYAFRSTDMNSIYGSCPGAITGTTTLTKDGARPRYRVSDATFGFWDCYGDSWGSGVVYLNDACGGLSLSGSDKYGVGYTFNFISNDGTTLTFTWVNGDGETGRVALTAPASKPWPSNLR